MTKSKRKTYKGKTNDKERTMAKIIAAVGSILKETGYTSLTSSNIARKAEVDRKLITLYFGSIENLVEIYIKEKDFWSSATIDAIAYFGTSPSEGSKGFLESFVIKQMDNFIADKEIQQAILWQLSENGKIPDHINNEREKMGALLFAFAEKEVTNHDIDLRTITSILIAGIQYLAIYSNNTNRSFYGINLDSEEAVERVKAMVKKILSWAHSN